MKQVILIKPTRQVQLSHLYEHLYYDALVLHFKKQNLLSYIDYSLHATTRSDFIHIGISLYTPEAEMQAGVLHTLEAIIDEDSIKRAFIEIIAEKKHNLESVYPNLVPIIALLKDIHFVPWKKIEEISHITPAGRKPSQTVKVTNKRAAVKNMHCSLIMDSDFVKSQPHLLPLFSIVARIIHDNLMDELSFKYGYYFINSLQTYTKLAAKESHTYTALKAAIPKLTHEDATCRDFIQELLAKGMVQRTVSHLTNIKYSTPQAAPDEIQLYEMTGQLIGTKGWREIATQKNVVEILSHTSLQLVYGKERQRVQLSYLLGTHSDN